MEERMITINVEKATLLKTEEAAKILGVSTALMRDLLIGAHRGESNRWLADVSICILRPDGQNYYKILKEAFLDHLKLNASTTKTI